jgi:multicomponent Na+:H+ antiporter subunit C
MMISLILENYNYYVCVVMMMLGLWAMIAKNNLIKKLIGMAIFQTSIILFYVSSGAKFGSTIPILTESAHGVSDIVDIASYSNPLPHVLMLTAIVVGVATLGLGLAIVLRLNQEHHTIEEDEILEKLNHDV